MQGILFKTEMVQANRDGRKHMTRRLIPVQPDNDGYDWKISRMMETTARSFKKHEGKLQWCAVDNENGRDRCDNRFFDCRFAIGDVIYTRETFCKVMHHHAHDLLEGAIDNSLYVYKTSVHEDWMLYAKEVYGYRWTPAIHMPRVAARFFHQVTAVRAERIMDISSSNAIAEGIESWTETRLASKPTRYKLYSIDEEDKQDPPLYTSCPVDSFRSLWQMINATPKPVQHKENGKLITTGYIVYPWGDDASLRPWHNLTTWRSKPLTVVPNPWVWVIEYKNISKEEAVRLDEENNRRKP